MTTTCSWIGDSVVLAIVLSLSLTLGTGVAGAATPTGETPAATVGNIEDTLLEAMHAGHRGEDYQARYELLAPVVQQTFDWPFAARTVMSTYWAKLDDSQQKKLADALFRCTAATYAANFNDYKGGTFHIQTDDQGEKTTSAPYRTVRSVFTEAGGKEHHFTYMLHNQQDDWQVINVIADGVSNLALDRGQFNEIMKSKGFDALLEYLNDTIDSIRATGDGQC